MLLLIKIHFIIKRKNNSINKGNNNQKLQQHQEKISFMDIESYFNFISSKQKY